MQVALNYATDTQLTPFTTRQHVSNFLICWMTVIDRQNKISVSYFLWLLKSEISYCIMTEKFLAHCLSRIRRISLLFCQYRVNNNPTKGFKLDEWDTKLCWYSRQSYNADCRLQECATRYISLNYFQFTYHPYVWSLELLSYVRTRVQHKNIKRGRFPMLYAPFEFPAGTSDSSLRKRLPGINLLTDRVS